MNVQLDGNFAFVDYELSAVIVLTNGKKLEHDFRHSLALKNMNGSWIIKQSHFSAPLAGQNPGQSFPVV